MSTGESSFTFLPLGAIIQEFRVAGRNIVQGFPTQELYSKHNTPYFGATIGRTSNRIKGGRLEDLNGQTYTLKQNNGPNNLHGGPVGWDKQVFEGPTPVNRNGKESVLFKYLSKDGDQGFPGTVELRVWYSASKEGGDSDGAKTVLEVEYEVEFVGDECEETVVGVTNHSYFSLGDGPTIEDTEVKLSTEKYLPLDASGIPQGHIERYTSTDVANSFVLTDTRPVIDDCFVVDADPKSVPLDTRSRNAQLLAAFKHRKTGVHLEVYSTEPAFQFYTGKYIDVPSVGGVPARGPRSGFCVEPSRYVNAAGHPEWRDMVLLKKGQIWGCKNAYKAWKE